MTGGRFMWCVLALGAALAGGARGLSAGSYGADPATNSWAFRPPRPPAVPVVRDAAWAATDVDRFLLAALEARGIAPVADADPRSLLRRVHLDLVGLPPEPKLAEAFERDPSPQAFARIVDDLLASPRFGERWARHWLDVARYAESTGKERNYAFSEAWRYRDWVIDAFNEDLPYDEFVRRQVAGDLMPAKDQAERDRNTVATAFLAIGPKGLNENNREQFLMDVVDEQIDVTTRAVMGVTVACARCHDHKFDPVSQRDYYAMAGIFRSTQTLYGTVTNQGNRHPSSLLALGRPPEPPVAAVAPKPDDDAGRNRGPKARRQRGRGMREPERPLPPFPDPGTERTMGVREGRVTQCAVLIRGEISQRGDVVGRGFVESLSPGPAPAIPAGQSGRLQLAEWLTGKSNPLTARVEANRIWQHLFGRGLVRTGDDFGAMGEKPTHPELLDHLALRLQSLGWSRKALIRELVLSHAYRLSSRVSERGLELDPDNTLLWRCSPRRLDAEVIRDSMLWAAGVLDLERPKGSPVTSVGDGPVRRLGPGVMDAGVARKRSVYLPVIRGFVPEALEQFDFADPSLVVAARDTTHVPPQALYFMNDEGVIRVARAFALRLLADAGLAPRERVERAYRLALGRPPTPEELGRALAFLREEMADALRSRGPSVRGREEAGPGSEDERRRRRRDRERPRPPGPGPRPMEAMGPGEQVWTTFAQALLASAEFRFVR